MLLSMVFALGLAGCATTSDLPTDYVLDPKQPEGISIMSLSLSGKPLEGVFSSGYRPRMVTSKNNEAVISRSYSASPTQLARQCT